MACIFVNANRSVGTINPNIYGQFSEHLGRCIYQGIYVGQASDIPNTNGMRNDVVSALKALHVPVLRWPGGCFADTYHWRDGIGPKENRKTIVNTNWGGVTEDNSFGTHEFMELCRQIGCEAYFSGNVGSGTVQEFSDWVEYCNMGGISPMASERRANGQDEPFNVKYWGIGNEAWGCGGSMRAEYYADLCRQYSTYLRNYSPEHKIFKIASGANVADYHWTKTVMERAGQAVDAVSLHYYTVPHEDWQHKGSATDFTDEEYYTTLHKTLQMEELVENHTRIIKQYQGDRKVGLAVDEWGTWYDVEPDTNPGFLYQQNTMRDALVAAINLNIFNNHCDTVCMANIAQMVNVLQAMILTEGSKMVLTPTYHVFEMYKGHQGAKQLESYAETTLLNHDDQAVPDLHVSASQQADGSILVTAANLNDTAAIPVTCMLGRGQAHRCNSPRAGRCPRRPQHLCRAGAGCPRGTEHQPDGGRLYRHPAAVQRSRFCGEPVMEAQPKRCRRCLLQDMADENDYYASVVRYRATMPRRVRTPDAEYTARLEHCRTCPSLNAGTCMQCGCYVEMRAARTDMHCPLDNAPW